MIILCSFVAGACYWDYRYRRIPNLLLLALFLSGSVYSWCLYSWKGLAAYILKVLVVTAIFFLIFRLGMIGGGDVKLLGVAAGFFEAERIPLFVLFSMLSAALVGVISMMIKKEMKNRISYLINYIKEFAKDGKIGVYMKDHDEKVKYGVVMSGPILLSVVLHLGGVY